MDEIIVFLKELGAMGPMGLVAGGLLMWVYKAYQKLAESEDARIEDHRAFGEKLEALEEARIADIKECAEMASRHQERINNQIQAIAGAVEVLKGRDER